MRGKEQSGSGSCSTPEKKRNKMLIFFLFIDLNTCTSLTFEHGKTWVTAKTLIVPFFCQGMVVFFLPLFCLCFLFFLSHIFRPFLVVWPFSISASAPSPFSSHPFSAQLQTNPLSLLPHHCYILIQTTVIFSTHIVQIPDLFYVWPVFGAVAPIVSAASKQRAI